MPPRPTAVPCRIMPPQTPKRPPGTGLEGQLPHPPMTALNRCPSLQEPPGLAGQDKLPRPRGIPSAPGTAAGGFSPSGREDPTEHRLPQGWDRNRPTQPPSGGWRGSPAYCLGSYRLWQEGGAHLPPGARPGPHSWFGQGWEEPSFPIYGGGDSSVYVVISGGGAHPPRGCSGHSLLTAASSGEPTTCADAQLPGARPGLIGPTLSGYTCVKRLLF